MKKGELLQIQTALECADKYLREEGYKPIGSIQIALKTVREHLKAFESNVKTK